MDVIIYHNPDCAHVAQRAGADPQRRRRAARHRLSEMPADDGAARRSCSPRAGLSVREILRKKGTPYEELGLDDPTLERRCACSTRSSTHPILMNRPLVVTPKGVRLCRPSEKVIDLLPPQRGEFFKEDGERVVDEKGRRVATA